ncbi:MAG: ATPase [Culturomica sp.]|jgi:N-acetylglucosamine kinase-like BadF-type ATPase|nr:ATPase [Culturomica sp.]
MAKGVLIADSGSTKTEWCVVRTDGTKEQRHTAGINPVYQSREEIVRLIREELPEFLRQAGSVRFYGAGCAFPEKNRQVAEALEACFGTADIEIHSDLAGAARALCGRGPGIACILGTGSNSCYYDGERIVQNIPPLGFILGDEGSGAYIGKRLLADALKGLLPADLTERLLKEIALSYPEIIDRVYRQPLPNRFLAGSTRFAAACIARPEIRQIVQEALDAFIRRNVLLYPQARELPVSFTGSVAWVFRELLQETLETHSLQAGHFSPAPMEGLLRYHCLL